MKNKVLIFIIGVLVGAIISTLGFYLYEKSNTSNNPSMPGGNMPQMMNQNGVTPPEKPSGSQANGQSNSEGDNNQGVPPSMPSEEQSGNQTTTNQSSEQSTQQDSLSNSDNG